MGSRLFAAYAAASLVPVVLLGVVLVRDSRREALESGLEQGRAQAAVIGEMAITAFDQGLHDRLPAAILKRGTIRVGGSDPYPPAAFYAPTAGPSSASSPTSPPSWDGCWGCGSSSSTSASATSCPSSGGTRSTS